MIPGVGVTLLEMSSPTPTDVDTAASTEADRVRISTDRVSSSVGRPDGTSDAWSGIEGVPSLRTLPIGSLVVSKFSLSSVTGGGVSAYVGVAFVSVTSSPVTVVKSSDSDTSPVSVEFWGRPSPTDVVVSTEIELTVVACSSTASALVAPNSSSSEIVEEAGGSTAPDSEAVEIVTSGSSAEVGVPRGDEVSVVSDASCSGMVA